ncbi:GNAT family N-acetyltransferase [Lactiplantibacillus daowaiensis]|uniref:GNAT family N-acetyltransferase n=1 Tax=Lactiplantibacillus daowaiensis TaxID=2559918 RepID=A0ABW1RX01_9LACO|nr:GNAT family N-acetyltransferase [Lactiplantibacillus daowaiensis]
MDLKVLAFDDLTPRQLQAIYKLRVAIFVVEQNCPYQEVDDVDLTAQHFMGLAPDGHLMAYARLMVEPNQQARIGRVIVNQADRGDGHGQQLINAALTQIKALWPQTTQVNIQAQHYLDRFYRSFGFKPVSPIYLEDGIPHQDMVLHL